MAVGAGTTLLLRQGPSGRRPIEPAWGYASRGLRRGARMAGRGARKAWKHSVDAWDRLPREQAEDRIGAYMEHARDAIEHAVESELKDLRRAIRRRRKKLGL